LEIGDRLIIIGGTNGGNRGKPNGKGISEGFNNRGVARKAKGDLLGAQKDYDEAARLRSPNR
jgi:hypothetical protein